MINLSILKDNPELAASLKFEITGNDILDLIKISPSQEIKKPVSTLPKSEEEAQSFLGVSRQTMHNWRKQGKLTFHTLGKRVYYFENELIEAMQTVKSRR